MKKTKNNPFLEFFKNINLAIYDLVHAGEFDIDAELEGELKNDPKEAYDKIQASALKKVEPTSRAQTLNKQRTAKQAQVKASTPKSPRQAPVNASAPKTAKEVQIEDDDRNL